jgi:hypothetical protein
MAKPTQEPGPGRSTSEAAFNDLKREIAQRNEQAHKAARKIRNVKEKEKIRRRRQQDLA